MSANSVLIGGGKLGSDADLHGEWLTLEADANTRGGFVRVALPLNAVDARLVNASPAQCVRLAHALLGAAMEAESLKALLDENLANTGSGLDG